MVVKELSSVKMIANFLSCNITFPIEMLLLKMWSFMVHDHLKGECDTDQRKTDSASKTSRSAALGL